MTFWPRRIPPVFICGIMLAAFIRPPHCIRCACRSIECFFRCGIRMENAIISGDCRGTSILEPGRFYFIPAFYAAEVHLDEDLYFLSIQSSLEICPGTELFSDCSSMQVLPAPAELPLLLKLFESPREKLPFSSAGIESGGLCSSDQGACALSGGGFSESAFAAALFRVDGLSFAARECLNPGFATGGLPGGVPGRIHPAFFFRNRNLSEAADRPFFVSKALDLLNGNASVRKLPAC